MIDVLPPYGLDVRDQGPKNIHGQYDGADKGLIKVIEWPSS